MTGKEAPIGIFDSGIGGLTVFREVYRNLPNENIVYFGDTARVPYGSKSPETVLRYSRQIVHFLKTCGVKALVVACNPASALALDVLEQEVDLPVLGVVKPGAAVACEMTKNRKIGLIATEITVKSGLYERLIRGIDPADTVYSKACPLLVPLVEEGWTDDPITLEVIKRYLGGLLEKDIDTLILGCTHYPLLRGLIRKYLGDSVSLVNPAYETARTLERMLDELDLKNPSTAEPVYQFYASDSTDGIRRIAERILPDCMDFSVQAVSIEEY